MNPSPTPSEFQRALRPFINFLAVVLLCLSGLLASAQSKEELQEERDKISQEIALTNKLLQETRDSRNKAESQLSLINRKILLREDLIRNLSGEIALYNRKIKENRGRIAALEASLQTLKENYAEMVRYAQRSQRAEDRLLFIFASKDLAQAIRRIRYLQQYARYRQQQAAEITATREQLDELNKKLLATINEKDLLMQDAEEGREALKSDLQERRESISELQQEENSLVKRLREQERQRSKLNKEIQRIIEEEIRASKKENAGVFALTPEAAALSSNFEKNRGKLPWPVERGVITARFGNNPHPVLPGIVVPNNGIDIATSANAPIRAVFDGTVSAVFGIPGAGQNVIINHGGYRSVYANLKEVRVSKGDKVTVRQVIGTVLTDEGSGKTEAHLEIWKVDQGGTSKQDPGLWISGQ